MAKAKRVSKAKPASRRGTKKTTKTPRKPKSAEAAVAKKSVAKSASATDASDASNAKIDEFERTLEFIRSVRERVATVVVGQEVVVERLLISLFTGGHLLLQGVPGLAKTLLVSAIAKSIDLDFSRIQFTVDLLPSDIVGSGSA